MKNSMYAARRRQKSVRGKFQFGKLGIGQQFQLFDNALGQFPQGGFIGHQVALHEPQFVDKPQPGAGVVEHHQHSSSWLKFMGSPLFPTPGRIALWGIALLFERLQNRGAFRLFIQKPRQLLEADAVHIMRRNLPILIQHDRIADRQAVPMIIRRAGAVGFLVQLLLLRQTAHQDSSQIIFHNTLLLDFDSLSLTFLSFCA